MVGQAKGDKCLLWKDVEREEGGGGGDGKSWPWWREIMESNRRNLEKWTEGMGVGAHWWQQDREARLLSVHP